MNGAPHVPWRSGIASIVLLLALCALHGMAFLLALTDAPARIVAGEASVRATVYAVLILLSTVLRVPTAGLFIVCAVRLRKNIDAFGETDLEYSTFFPWWFAVPFLNLVVPVLAFQELWAASEPGSVQARRLRRKSKLIYSWWVAFAVAGVTGTLPSLLAERDRAGAEAGLAAPFNLCSMVAAVLCALMVWRLLRRQAVRADAVYQTPRPPDTFAHDRVSNET